MGRSDPVIFKEYTSMISGLKPKTVALLGFSCENDFTLGIDAQKSFFDIALNNWDINSKWQLDKKYDLIISTRCPYFAKDPNDFIIRCKEHLNQDGKIFIDWGLGDHWRFKQFKVGWVRNNEHEFAYHKDNFLYSCLWKSEFMLDKEVQAFWNNVKGRFGYGLNDDLTDIVNREVPRIIDYEWSSIKFKFLWPDSPQLYIMTLI